jgi:HAE1 family hydrophobic/amphiphilic exporter-1
MALIGVIWAFLLCHVTLNIVIFFGIVMLLGVVVNNGIVLVDYTNLLRARGQKLKESLLNAGKSRLRPVLMTSLTTIFGMVPMAVSTGLGSEIWRPLGISVIGGLVVSTLITLILIPLFYYFAHHKDKNGDTI